MKRVRIALIAMLASVMALSSCKEDEVKPQTDATETKNTDDKTDTTTKTSLEGTKWTVEISVGFGDDESTLVGTMNFTADNKFDYSEIETQVGGGVSFKGIDDFNGTYTYSGKPDEDGNLVLSFTDSDGNAKTIQATLTVFELNDDLSARTIEFIVDDEPRTLGEETEDTNDDDDFETGPTTIDNTTWLSNTFFSDDFEEDVSIEIEFETDGVCQIKTISADGSVSGEEKFSVDGNVVTIKYFNNIGLEETQEGTISGNTISITLYGEAITLTKK